MHRAGLDIEASRVPGVITRSDGLGFSIGTQKRGVDYTPGTGEGHVAGASGIYNPAIMVGSTNSVLPFFLQYTRVENSLETIKPTPIFTNSLGMQFCQ